jgi:hypothetical protein
VPVGGVPTPGNSRASKPEVELYECFKDVNDFAIALGNRGWCGDVAHRALSDSAVGHLGKGLAFYLRPIFDQLEALPIVLVRFTHMREDLTCLFARVLASPSKALSVLSDLPHANSDYERRNSTFLNETGRTRLAHALGREYTLLTRLERLSSLCTGPTLRTDNGTSTRYTHMPLKCASKWCR